MPARQIAPGDLEKTARSGSRPDRKTRRRLPRRSTVSERTPTPMRNICSLPMTRARSSASSKAAASGDDRAGQQIISARRGSGRRNPHPAPHRVPWDGATVRRRVCGAMPRMRAIRSSSRGLALSMRENLHPGRQSRQETIEGDKSRVGIAGAGEGCRASAGMISVSICSRPGAAHRGKAAEMPAADRGRYLARPAGNPSGAASRGFRDHPRRR